MDCPESIVGSVGVGAVGAVSAGSIVNVEYSDETVFAPESVTTTFASSGLFDVSVEVVWNVYAIEFAVCPVSRSLRVITEGVMLLATSIL